MNQADDPSQRVIAQYAALKRRFSIFTLILIFALALIIGAVAFSDPRSGYLLGLPLAWVLPGSVALVGLIGTALSLKYWRCPACGKYMGGVWFMRHCPRCGVRLRP